MLKTNMFRVAIASLIFITSCSAPQKRFEAQLQSQNCEAALEQLPENDSTVQLVKGSQQALGTAAAYTFIGASYTAEVLWDFTAGTVVLVALCSPMLLITTASSVSISPHYRNEDGTNRYPGCFPGKVGALSSPPLGRRAKAATQSLRCPDLTSLSQSVRSVASCFERRGDEVSRSQARQALEALQKSDRFYECLPEQEQTELQRQLQALK